MMTSHRTSDGEDSGYGLGLFIDTLNGQPRVGHTGGSFGFTAANFYFPAQKLRVITLTNNADMPEAAEIISTAIFNDVFPELAREAMQPARDEDPAVTATVKASFEHLQSGTTDASLFAATLDAKMKAGLANRMAGTYGPYGAPTAFVFKGQRPDGGKKWSDYLIAFGPGNAVKFSVALDGDGKVVSFGFNTF
jgi:hypothetical protein